MAGAHGVARPSPFVTVVIDVERLVPEMSNTDFMVTKDLPAPIHAPNMTIAVPVRQRENSIAIARSQEKRRENNATKPTIADVTEEGVLNGTEAAKLLHVSPEAVASREAYSQARKTVCCIYAEDFRSIHKTCEVQFDKAPDERVYLLPYDPPYNVRR